MADRVYLSIWLQDFTPENMLEHWRRAMEAFPASEIAPGVSLAIYPFDWSETPVLERSFGGETDAGELATLSYEFLHDDYAYEAEIRWDLWLPASGGAESAPARVVEESEFEEREREGDNKIVVPCDCIFKQGSEFTHWVVSTQGLLVRGSI